MRKLTGLLTTLALSTAMTGTQAYQLDILHINDHHSHLQTNRLDLKLDGKRTRVAAGGFPAVTAAMAALGAGKSNLLKLHAGDAITGDLYYTLFKGEADAALMNTVCFDAFAVGNHEFDDGDAGLAKFLDHLHSGDCKTPVLAANVKPEVGKSPLAKKSAGDYLKSSVIVERGGVKIGIIGIDVANKTRNSSNPDASTEFLDEVATAQFEVGKLLAKGVGKIILLTHYQYKNDLKLASMVRGVDVIVGGDSHTLLGDFDAVGLRAGGPYPTEVTNKDGDKVCVVQAWEYANVVGHLTVKFDRDVVESCAGTPHLLLADSFKRKHDEGKRVELEGAARDAAVAEVKAHPSLMMIEGDADASALLSGYAGKVKELKSAVIGKSNATLCLERIPGQGKSKACDKNATASNGSDISNVVSKAFLQMSKTSDIAVQNGGGVRVDLLEGDVTIGDAYTLLPFANTLTELTMTGAELKAVLEEALDYAMSEGGSTGAYPYAAGLRWHVDASKPAGERFSGLEVNARMAGTWKPLDAGTKYTIVTNSYIAGGKDGYKTFGAVSKRGDALNTYLDYAQSFVDYVKAVGTLGKLPIGEYSTQSFTNKDGKKQ
ncbi:MAG: NAD nucleotidase [Pseudomonadota bacterium]